MFPDRLELEITGREQPGMCRSDGLWDPERHVCHREKDLSTFFDGSPAAEFGGDGILPTDPVHVLGWTMLGHERRLYRRKEHLTISLAGPRILFLTMAKNLAGAS